MKNNIKRNMLCVRTAIVLSLLVFSAILSCMWLCVPVRAVDLSANDAYMSDDFASDAYMNGVTYQWNTTVKDPATDSAVVSDGRMRITAASELNTDRYNTVAYLSQSDGVTDYAQQWTDYSVEIKGKILSSSTGTGHDKIGVIGRMTETNGTKSFYYAYFRKNAQNIWLYRGTTASDGRTELTLLAYPAIPQKTVADTDYILRISFEGDTIKVFLDGEEYINVTDTTNTCGTVGIMGARGVVADVDYIKVTTNEISESFVDTFDDARYITGIERKWNTTVKNPTTDSAVVSGGKMRITVASELNTDRYNTVAYLSQSDGVTDYAQQWTDYSVEMKGKILSSSTGTGHDKIGVIGRMTETNGTKSFYYAYFRKNAQNIWLYRGTAASDGRTELTLLAYHAIPQKTVTDVDYTLKMSFEGNTIKVFLDDEEYINVTDTTNTCGSVGIMGARGVVADVDYIKVIPVGADAANCFSKYTFDTVSTIDELNNTWNLTPAESGAFSIVDDQLIYSDSASGTGFAAIKAKQLTIATDCQVIAEGTVDQGSGFAVYGRYNAGTSSYYKLAVDLDDGITLKKKIAGVETELFSISRNELWECYGIMLNEGALMQIKLQFYRNRVEAFLGDLCVYYFDDSDWVEEGVLSSGVGAVELQSGARLTSLEIAEVDIITNLSVMLDTNCNGKDANLKNNLIPFSDVIEVPVGYVPDLKHLYLQVIRSDETDTIVPVDAAEISEFVTDTVGVKTATITYERRTTQILYRVIDRSEELAQINSDLAAIQVSSLSLDDKTTIDALAERYNALTASEKDCISSENKTKLADAKDKIELLLYPELAGTSVVFEDSFDYADAINRYTSDRMQTRTSYLGTWFVENGTMQQYFVNDTDRTTSFQCASVVKDGYWEIKSVSADAELIDRNAWMGLIIPYGENNYYRFLISDKKSAGNYESRIYLWKDDTSLAYQLITDPAKAFVVGEIYNLRVIFDEGWIRCYINDELVLEAEDAVTPATDIAFTKGNAGFYVAEGFGKFDNFVVRGHLADNEESAPAPARIPGSYIDNFNDETPGTDPSHWIEGRNNEWVVTADSAYGCSSCTDTSTQTWLHVFETNVDLTAKLKVTASGRYPVVGLMARVNYDDSYVKAGYDFTLGKWFIKIRYGTDFNEVAVYSEQDTTVDFTDWTTLRLSAVGSVIALYCGESTQPVLSADAMQKVMPGRVGIFAERCNVSVDDVNLQLLSGQGRVNDGVMEFYTAAQYCSILTLPTYDGDGPNDDLLMFSYTTREVSSDGGKTFTATSEYGSASLGTATRLHDGRYFAITGGEAYLSTDCKVWNHVGTIPVSYKNGSTTVYTATGDRVTEVEISENEYRIFFTLDKHINAVESGVARKTVSEVFYSDDFGETWSVSTNSAAQMTNMATYGETNIIRAVDGTLIQYCSYNNSQQMRYMVSHDNGVTWEGDYAIPYLIDGGVVSFCVKEDPYELGTYYMSTVFNRTQHNKDGMPRLRIVLLRSHNGYDWEFLGDVDRWGNHSEGSMTDIMQNINMYLAISPDAVFPMFCRAEQWKPGEAHNIRYGRAYRFDKEKISAYNYWPLEETLRSDSITHIEGVETDILQNSDPGDVAFTVFYYNENGDVSEVKYAADAFISGLDTAILGEQTVVLDYKHFRTVFTVNVVESLQPAHNCPVYAGRQDVQNPNTVANPFADITKSDWFYDDVMFSYEKELMLGTSATTFNPYGTAARSMMATILWRMEGSLAAKGKNSFSDVEAGKWYTDAIIWAVENKVYSGYSNGKFDPDSPITREQLAAILYRYANYAGCDMTVADDLSKFMDADKISDYAKPAMQWAVGSGLLNGRSDGTLDPQGTATRAEVAAILHRFIEKFGLEARQGTRLVRTQC